MLLLNSHNFSIFFILVYSVENWGFNFQTTGILKLYFELRCERTFSESYMVVSIFDERNLLVIRWNFKDLSILFQME